MIAVLAGAFAQSYIIGFAVAFVSVGIGIWIAYAS
jgi:ABC-type spermidine/putrescine transport system permease subunit II